MINELESRFININEYFNVWTQICWDRQGLRHCLYNADTEGITLLETKRCYLKMVKESDKDYIVELYLNDRVRKFLGGVESNGAIHGVLRSMFPASSEIYHFSFFLKESDDFIGRISITPHYT